VAFADLRADIERLVILEEFAPTAEILTETTVTEVDGASELVLVVDLPTIREAIPEIAWLFTMGGGRRLRLEISGRNVGVQAVEDLIVPAGATLFLSAEADGLLRARLGSQDVTGAFANLDGSTPPRLPAVPEGRSEWKFRAVGGLFGVSAFDGSDTFDLPRFRSEMRFPRFQPLTFDVYVPYFLEKVVRELAARRGYTGKLLVFSGLPPERIQEVVNQTKAAGVRGSVHFTLNFFDTHDQTDSVRGLGERVVIEDADATEMLTVGSVERLGESQDQVDRVVLGGVFDLSAFDGSFGFHS
jgi:hypothetical protein